MRITTHPTLVVITASAFVLRTDSSTIIATLIIIVEGLLEQLASHLGMKSHRGNIH